MSAAAVVVAFIDAINAHDVPRIAGLCAPDHEFVDGHGNVVAAGQVRDAWAAYFRFMPAYGIEIETLVAQDDVVAVFGFAWGNLDGADGTRAWRRPAAWRVRIECGLIRLWQVYVDTKVVFDLIEVRV